MALLSSNERAVVERAGAEPMLDQVLNWAAINSGSRNLGGLERMAGFVETRGAAAGVDEPLQMTVGVTDGQRLYAARYASGQTANTLYYSADTESLRQLYPADERFAHFGPEARAVVSEPLVALPGLWHEVPSGSALTVEKGRVQQSPFRPRQPDKSEL